VPALALLARLSTPRAQATLSYNCDFADVSGVAQDNFQAYAGQQVSIQVDMAIVANNGDLNRWATPRSPTPRKT
jgi:hypothetical protein